MEKKAQHWITKSYLDAWIAPSTPPHQEGYVWLFNKNNEPPKKKAPHNIFKETDFYKKTY
jgi:hypothetical protein